MKKKKIIIIGIIIFVIIAIGIVCIVIFHNKKSGDKGETSSKNSDTIIVDLQKALDETLDTAEKDDMPLYLVSLKEKADCKVLSASATDDNSSYTAIVKVTYADASEAIVNYLEEHSNEPLDEERINKDISELVSKSELSTSECEIYFIPNGDSYSPVFTEEIIDKMYGGIYSAYYNKLDEIASEQKGSDQE